MDSDRLHDYFDGRLAPDEKARFERRLAEEPALADRLRELRELDAALGTLPGHAAPADFTERVAAAARRRRGGIFRIAAPLAAAAALLVAVFLGDREVPAPPKAVDRYIWETDEETYGSLALTDLEDQILEELEGA
jgi:anti-sigma factor RsiW